MESYITPANTMFVLGIAGVVFSVYHYFKNPQIAIERREVGIKGELSLLRQELQNLKDNHIHSIEARLTALEGSNVSLSKEMTRLGTIIEERIPRKHEI